MDTDKHLLLPNNKSCRSNKDMKNKEKKEEEEEDAVEMERDIVEDIDYDAHDLGIQLLNKGMIGKSGEVWKYLLVFLGLSLLSKLKFELPAFMPLWR